MTRDLDKGAKASAIENVLTAVANPKDTASAAGLANLPITATEATSLLKDAGQLLKNIIQTPPPPPAPTPPAPPLPKPHNLFSPQKY